MFRIFLFIIFFALYLTNGIAQTRSYEIKGSIEGKPAGKIFLYCYDEKGNIANTTASITNQQFYFKGEIKERAKASLSVDGMSGSVSFFMDTGKINIKLKPDTQYHNGTRYVGVEIASITGSKSQAIWDETVDHFRKVRECEAPDSVKAEDYYSAMLTLVKQYPQHYVTRELLGYAVPVSSYEQMKSLFNYIPKEKQETPAGDFIKKQMATLKATQANTYIFFPTQKDESREELTLDKLDFKYLLIDFWASWCAPCREEHPAMIKQYNQHKPSGLEVLSISLDDQKENWQKAIKADKLPWAQVSDLKGWHTEIITHYGIRGIPYNMLIDRNGKIIASNLRKESLARKLKELLSK